MRALAGHRSLRRGRVRSSVHASSVLALAVTSHAAARDVALEYRVDSECPAREWFLPRLAEALIPLDESRSPDVALHVARGELGGFVGQLELTQLEPGGTTPGGAESSWSRTIEGASCSEVLSALAMSLSIHLEGDESPSELAPRGALDAEADGNVGLRASVPLARPSSGHAGALGTWQLGLLGGGHVRSSLSPGLDFSGRLGLNADRVGPNAQSYVLSFSVSGGQGAELPASFGTLAWEHRWWAVGAQACRFGLGLLSWLRLEPCASVHGGRYQAELLAGSSSTDWLVLAELTAQLRVSSGPWVGRVELGGFAPVSPLVMRRDGEAFYQQGLGVTVGLSVAVLPLTFSSGGG